MRRADWAKRIEDSIKDGMIITATTPGGFCTEGGKKKPPKASLEAMHIIKRAGKICGGVYVKYFEVCKKKINN